MTDEQRRINSIIFCGMTGFFYAMFFISLFLIEIEERVY